MRFLANENFPLPSILLLRENGFYVKSVSENMSGIKDNEVLEIGKQEGLIILTFDKDYGELIFRYANNAPPAIVFFRYKGVNPAFAGEFLLKVLLDKTISLIDNFTVIEENSFRQRKYSG
jgi:predicted nuclease of predicted toxin-antitoxin system